MFKSTIKTLGTAAASVTLLSVFSATEVSALDAESYYRANEQAAVASSFTDVRLGYSFLPTDSSSGGTVDSSARFSATAFGPVHGWLPVGRGTPARIQNDIEGESRALRARRGHNVVGGYDLLLGFELSQNSWTQDSINTDFNATALTFLLGWGTEMGWRVPGRLHWEWLFTLGAGQAEYKAGNSEGDGLYYEYGGRLGGYVTLDFGMQIGMFVGYQMSVLDFESGQEDLSGITYGATMGYRF